jgi:hypothetical protein
MNTKYMFSSVTIIGIISLSPIIRAQTYQPTNRIPVADNSRIGTQVSGTNNNFAITGGVNWDNVYFIVSKISPYPQMAR